jgi:parallel beta-helix repeat protein
MPDGFESLYGLDPEIDDSGEDLDGDGLTNLEEFWEGTYPDTPDSDDDGLSDGDEAGMYGYGTNPLEPDTDGDNLDDGDEAINLGTNPLLADSDGDLVNDDVEITQGTNPLDDRDFPATPGVYYVDIDHTGAGDDAQHGTSAEAPWQTLHFAIDRINAGTAGTYTLHVGLGTYSVGNGEADAELQITQPGLTVLGESGSMPLIDGTGASAWYYGVWSTASSVVMDNLEVANFIDMGIKIEYAGSGSVTNCVVHDTTDTYSHGIVLVEVTDGFTVEGNEVFGNYGGIDLNSASPLIARNVISDNDIGIAIAAWGPPAASPTIINNVITTPRQYAAGIFMEADTGGTVSPLIYHNTLHASSSGAGAGIYMTQSVYADDVSPIIYYNSITGWDTGIHNNGAAPAVDYNNVWDTIVGYENTSAGPNDISKDPRYANPGAGDFDLADGSPAIDAIPLAAGDTVSGDILGRNRPLNNGYDMGAYESTGQANRPPDAAHSRQSGLQRRTAHRGLNHCSRRVPTAIRTGTRMAASHWEGPARRWPCTICRFSPPGNRRTSLNHAFDVSPLGGRHALCLARGLRRRRGQHCMVAGILLHRGHTGR